MKNLRLLAGVFLAVGVMCGQIGAVRAQAPGGGPPPPTPVVVVTLEAKDITLTSTLPGRVVASGVAEVRPQVDGIIKERLYEEGADVELGEPLYQIDPETYEALVAAAKAQVTSAEAQLRAAERDEQRLKELLDRKVASEQNYDTALAARDAAAAALAVAQAQLQSAQINLERTTIRAPLSGVIGRSLTTRGALVTNGQTDPLAVVRDIDTVLVDVTQSAAEVLAWRRGLVAKRLKNAESEVVLTLADGTDYEEKGELRAAEPYVNEETGVVTLRLRFPNPNRLLLPGMYVQVAMPQGVAEGVLEVPQEAVSRDRRGRPTVFVVSADNVVEERMLEIIQAHNSNWIVSEGLNSGDRVIVEGLQKVRPGATVVPQERGAEPPAPSGTPQASAAPAAAATAAPAPAEGAKAAPAPAAGSAQAATAPAAGSAETAATAKADGAATTATPPATEPAAPAAAGTASAAEAPAAAETADEADAAGEDQVAANEDEDDPVKARRQSRRNVGVR